MKLILPLPLLISPNLPRQLDGKPKSTRITQFQCFSCFPMGFWSGFCWLVVWRSENWWSFVGCFSLGDGGLGFGGLKCGFTTRFWRGEGGV
ncbi:hypothetical protein H5410_031025 [Solanum commersonii]|uniref:Uncharacterized protein n=1 Tax=Solanum commersonii TaxID=4109 RepID=A0A9J5YIN4_SOLCO|nr:hypothetical protein H5410_031025 [Solanum commersonii]